jgi:hypothetical protein
MFSVCVAVPDADTVAKAGPVPVFPMPVSNKCASSVAPLMDKIPIAVVAICVNAIGSVPRVLTSETVNHKVPFHKVPSSITT